MLKRVVAALALFIIGLVTSLVVASPAHAAYTNCVDQPLTFATGPYVAGDGANVTRSYFNHINGGSCDRPYVGHSDQCATFRFVVWNSPMPDTYGPWFKSCWTPQPGASGEHGWISVGQIYYVEYSVGTGQNHKNFFNAHAWT